MDNGQETGNTLLQQKKNRRQLLLAAVGRPKAVPANFLLL